MKHFSENYRLATSFNVSYGKLVRFFNGGGMYDVAVSMNEENELEAALNKAPKPLDFSYDEHTKKIWSVCNYIISNMNNSIVATDFFDGCNYSKISIEPVDYYNFRVLMKITHNNKTFKSSKIFDHGDTWFLFNVINFVNKLLPRAIFKYEQS